MSRIIVISGPCGSGKTTLADRFARHLAAQDGNPVYLIHGDDFHHGFVEPDEETRVHPGAQAFKPVPWAEILRFNWDCILTTADRALRQGTDVVIDYIVEDELPRLRKLAKENRAAFYYIVLTASTEEIERRIRQRGDPDLIDRALFLKEKLDNLPENQEHLFDNTRKMARDVVREIVLDQYLVADADR